VRTRSALAAIARAIACGALAGCSLVTDSFRTNDFSGDPFPIQVRRDSGAVLVGAREIGGPDLVAVLDVLSPVTLIDPGLAEAASVGTSDVMLLGRRDAASDGFDLPRARLRDTEVISLHPCTDAECAVGPLEGQPPERAPYGAIIGANALAGDALRLRLSEDQVFLLADIGGDERDRTYVCDAVFPAPYRGGGTLLIRGTEVAFGGRRVMLQACLGADPDPDRAIAQNERGADALLVMSTGIGMSLLSETAYERYRQARARDPSPPPPLESLRDAWHLLPSGPVPGRIATIHRIALAASSSSSSRAPCRQAYAHRLLTYRNCIAGEDCPCSSPGEFCVVPAVVELAAEPDGLRVLVVSDANPTLQALRAELRPDQPEVDGILGADALALAELDIDYPHNRVLARCPRGGAAGACVARPALAEAADRGQVQNCIGQPAP
jgi:hypothetical protein